MDVRDEDLCFSVCKKMNRKLARIVPIVDVDSSAGGTIATKIEDQLHLPATTGGEETDSDADSEDIDDAIRLIEMMIANEQNDTKAAEKIADTIIVSAGTLVDEDAKYEDVDMSCTPEELEDLQMGFAKLKSFITGLVSIKKIRAWEGIKMMLDSGKLSDLSFEASLTKIGVDTPHAQLNFNQFKRLMVLLVAEFEANEKKATERDKMHYITMEDLEVDEKDFEDSEDEVEEKQGGQVETRGAQRVVGGS